jgi:hypothetical protein
VLNGHDHLYERYPQLNPSGSPDTNGVREFVVGTGGEDLVGYYPAHVSPTAPTYDDSEFGVLVLTLHTNSYHWAFKRALDGATMDSGSATCHRTAVARATRVEAARALNVNAAPNPRLFLPRLTFDARPQRTSLTAAESSGIPVAIHISRTSDITIRAWIRRAGRLEQIASFYETETQAPTAYDVIYLQMPARQLRGLKRATLVLRFAAVDSANHHRAVMRTASLSES